MLTLAIETSGPMGSLALLNAEQPIGEELLELGKQHGQSLIPAIGRVLAAAGKQPREVDLVAVSVGPGSFTGLRVGIVCAKTFAYVTRCRLAGIDTLRAIACNAPADVSRVEVICDAHRGDLFVGRYVREAGSWRAEGPIAVVSAGEWIERIPSESVVTGPALAKLAAQVEGKCRLLPPETRVPSALWIGRLGVQAIESGEESDPWSLQPVYLRRSSAELQWERLHPGG